MVDKNLTPNVDIKAMKQALAVVDQLYAKNKKNSEMLNAQKEAWNGISTTIFGIAGSEWFDKIPKTTEELAKSYEEIKQIDGQIKTAGDSLNNAFKANLPNIQKSAQAAMIAYEGSIRNKSKLVAADLANIFGESADKQQSAKLMEKMAKQLEDMADSTISVDEAMKKMSPDLKENEKLMKLARGYLEDEVKFREDKKKLLTGDLQFINDIGDKTLKHKVLEALAEGKIDKLLQENGAQALAILSTDKTINAVLGDGGRAFVAFNEKAEEAKKILSETHTITKNLAKGFLAWGKNLASGIIPRMLQFDGIIHDMQKTTGIMFTENAAAMTTLTRKTSEFGMSTQETAEFMGSLSEELRTTNFGVLGQATDDLKAIQMATGVSGENLGIMAGEMMRNGKSSAQVADSMVDANVMAKRFGVSSKKVLDGMSKNITKMRTMGFTGGEKSLIKMVATAERLRMNVDEVFDVAKKARSIEGAMEMAAELQLASGSFSNINPMDLLAAARKGPAELQKILTTMGGDIGKFSKNASGEMEYVFDPVDVDRLQIVADATGQSLDSMQKMIQKNAEDNQKINLMPDISFEGLKDAAGNPIDPDAIKATLMDSVNMTGEALDGSILDKAGIQDLGKITREQAQKIMQDQILKDKNLEEQAKQNMGFEKSMTAFKDALLNIFTYLEPVVEGLTGFIQMISKILNSLGTVGHWILALTVALLAIPMLTAALGKATFAMNFKNLGTIFKGGGINNAMNMKNMGGAAGKGVSTGKNTLGDSISKTSEAGGKIKSTPGKSGLETLAQGLKKMGDPKVLAGVGNTALAGPALLLLLPGLPSLALLGVIGLMDKAVVKGFEAIAKGFKAMGGKSATNIVKGALVLMIVGAALAVVGIALTLFAQVSWETLAMAGVALLGLVAVMALIGVMMMGPMGVGMLAGAFALLIIAGSLALTAIALIIFAKGMEALAKIDWAALSGVGPALMSMVGPLMLFALAGMAFANPITMLGMLLMVGVLASVALVLIPLAMALEMGAKGLDSMASGVMKLSDSLQKLDFEKLDKLKEFSSEMADAASGSAIVEAMDKLASAMGAVGGKGGGGTSGGGTKTLVVQLKMPNGRILEEHIIKDLDSVS